MQKINVLAAVAFLSLLIGSPHGLQAQSSFYRDKTITIIVGTVPGGLYDLWGRLFSRIMGKYIPGNPGMVVRNMPGGGSMIAANYLSGVAKPDGLTIGMFQTHMYLQQLVRQPEVKFDVLKFNWLGSQEKGTMVLYIRGDSPYRSIDEIIKAREPPKCGATGLSDQTTLFTRLLEETIGARFTRVLGYQGGSEVDLAMERGEIICRATRVTVHFSREPFISWDKKGFDRHLVQAGDKRDPRLPDTPTILELMDKYKTSEVGRRFARVILAGDELGRPMVAPPGVPLERVKILREAYNKALKDPELLDEVKRSRLDMEPITGQELEVLYKELMDQPRAVVDLVKKLESN
ncbi:MAG: Bug family tripartite tricarboxylate transporter substrate binding protein [Candidatus Binatia bacterium]